MSLFDDIYGSYILEDNMGTNDPDDTTQQDQGGDDGADNQETDTQDAGTDDTPDDGGDDNADQDDQGDEYEMNDPENDDTQEGEEDATDQDDDQGDEYEMNDPEDDTSEENTEDEGEEGGDGDEYEMNDPESDDSDTAGTDDETEDPTDPSQKLKEIEKSIFDQLTPEQQKTKTAELKNLYTETYEKCQSIIDIVSGIEKAPNQARVYDYIVKNLVDLQKYIRDYLENLFDSKTYIENMTELQKYLAILDTINNVFAEMQKKSESDANK